MLRLLLFLLLALPTADACAQDTSPLHPRLTLSVGGYRFHEVGYQPTPRIEIATDLVHLDRALLALGVSLSWSRLGYRSGDVAPGCHDCASYDYAGYGLGGRVYAELVAAPLPVRLSLGLFHHAGRVEFRRSDPRDYAPSDDYAQRVTRAELGLGFAWPLHRHLEAAADFRVYPMLETLPTTGPEISVTVGLGVRL